MNKIKLSYNDSHKIINNTLYKLCSKCDKWFPCTEKYFYKTNSKNQDGLFPYCKKCNKKKVKQWEKDNPEKYKILFKKRNAADKQKERMRKNSNRQKENGYYKTWQKNNTDKIKQYNLYKEMNKTHNISKEEWKDCKEYFNNCCAYCGISNEEAKKITGNYLHKEHVDHEGANDLSNCVPACKSCNSQKNIFTLDEWYNNKNINFNQERLNKIHKWLREDYKLYKNED